MASRDLEPTSSIIIHFPNQKIRRIHSTEGGSNSSIYTINRSKEYVYSNTQKKPQLKQVWEISDIEKQNLLLATAALFSCTRIHGCRWISGIFYFRLKYLVCNLTIIDTSHVVSSWARLLASMKSVTK